MDSVTQAVFGASVAGLVAPTGHRRKAAAVGAALGTLPDLDVFLDYGDAVSNFTYHRGFSHSLFVLPPAALVIWALLKRSWSPVREAPRLWLLAIFLALVTHPLLDAHTAYGTQLFWPMTVTPTMWATLFIIDPLFTLPLLVGLVCFCFWPGKAWSYKALASSFALCCLYVSWTWVAQTTVVSKAEAALSDTGIRDAQIFSTPTPFNTLLWRIVVKTETGFLEGYESLVIDEGELRFSSIESDSAALRDVRNIDAVARLRWFSDDFVKADVVDDQLIIRDLRMGLDPNYVFSHVVAVRENNAWQPVRPEQLPFSNEDRGLAETWRRIWEFPATR